jgi:hypothetical protein
MQGASAKSPAAKTALVTGAIADPGFPDRLVDAAVGAFGRLDILVNRAGVKYCRLKI